jgi:hypothetical protein
VQNINFRFEAGGKSGILCCPVIAFYCMRYSSLKVALSLTIAAAYMCRGSEPAAPLPAGAAATQPARHASEIEALIAGLSSADPVESRRAQRRCVAFGGETEPWLAALIRQTHDENVRVNAQLALQDVTDARYALTTFVTLNYDNAPAADVFEELFRQGFVVQGIAIDGSWPDRKGPPLTIHVEHQPFLAVLRDLCAKEHVAPEVCTNGAFDLLPFHDNWEPPSFIAPGYLVRLRRVSHTVDVSSEGKLLAPMLEVELEFCSRQRHARPDGVECPH